MGTPFNRESSLTQRIDAQKERIAQYRPCNVPATVRDEIVRFVEETSREWKVSQTDVLSRLDVSRSTFYYWKSRLGTTPPNSYDPKHNELHTVEKWTLRKIYELFGSLSSKRLALMMIDQNIVYVAPRTMYRYLELEGIPKQRNRDVGRLFRNLGTAGTADEKWIVTVLRITKTSTVNHLVLAVDVYSGMIIDWTLHDVPFKHRKSSDLKLYIKNYMEEFSSSLRQQSSNAFVKIEKRLDPVLTFESLFQLSRIAVQYCGLLPEDRCNYRNHISTTTWSSIREYMNQTPTPPDEEEQRIHPESFQFWDDAVNPIISVAIGFYNESLPQSSLGYFTPRTVYEGTTSKVRAARKRKLQAKRKRRTFDWECIRDMHKNLPPRGLPEATEEEEEEEYKFEDEDEDEDEDLCEAEFEEDPAQLRFRF